MSILVIVLHYLELIASQIELQSLQHLLQILLLDLQQHDITQFTYQISIRLISQLISSISRVLQKLLPYFNGSIISASLTV